MRLIFLFFIILELPLFAVNGTVFLSNGKQHSGKIFFNRSLKFREIYTNRFLSFSLSQVYRISTIEEKDEFSRGTLSKKHYLIRVTTWQGDCYFGKFSAKVTVQENRKKKEFILSQVKKQFTIPQITCIVFQSASLETPPLFSLSGKISPNLFQTVHVLHQDFFLVFSNKIDQSFYEIPEILPGNYDFIFVGKEFIALNLTPSLRKGILDKQILDSSLEFKNWIEKQALVSSTSKKELIYVAGHYSFTKAILAEELSETGERFYWLCLCSYKGIQWNFHKILLLQRQKKEEPLLVFMFFSQLGNVFCPFESTVYDVVLE